MKGTTVSRGMRARLSLATTILTGLALLCLFLLVIANFHNKEYRRNQADLRKLSEDITALDFNALAVNLAAMDAIVDKDSGVVDKELFGEVTNAETGSKKIFLELTRNPAAGPDTQQALAEISVKFDTLVARTNDVFKSISSRSGDERAFAALDDAIDETRVKISEISAKLRKQASESESENDKQAEQSGLFILALQAVILLSLVGASQLIVRRSSIKISSQIENASESLGQSGNQVGKETSELQRHALALTATVNTQASGVTETVAAMTEIQSILKRNTESLSAASRALNESAESSAVGLRQSKLMAQALSDLNTASGELEHIVEIVNKIGAKTEVINAIVFKTQVLAFNASIEASRAGEHGKGFSAVAQEVSRLADLSGQAAGEIGNLLESSRSQVNKILNEVTRNLQTTITVSDQVRSHFEGLAGRVMDVSRSVADVSMGAKEQLTGIEQCSRAMTDMNAATHEVNLVSSTIGEQCKTLQFCVKSIQDATVTLSAIVRGSPQDQVGPISFAPGELRSLTNNANQPGVGAPRSAAVPSATGLTQAARTGLSEDARAALLLERFRNAGANAPSEPAALQAETVHDDSLAAAPSSYAESGNISRKAS